MVNYFKVHEDYDKLKEPWRFLIALYFMLPFYVGIYLIEKYPLGAIIGVSFVAIMVFHRMIYLNKRRTK